ncbi:MAG: L,D-transpeptidase family protein [Candidatus Nealsonbacteria bacterium]
MKITKIFKIKKTTLIVLLFFILSVSFLLFFYFKSFFISKKIVFEDESRFYFDLPSILEEEKRPSFINFFEEVKQDFISNKKDFLEANLAEMKMRVYRQGSIGEEVPILTKGDTESWGGSPVGIYEVLSGGIKSFSVAAKVYMPYALHYYGRYYFHGEPEYTWGEKLVSRFSGGCLRLKNEDAKIIFESTEIGMPVLVIDKERDNYEYIKENTYNFPEVSSNSYLIADLDSGYIFAEKDYQKQFPIASVTKLMTALVLSENFDLEKTIMTKDYMLNGYGSTKGIEDGKRYRLVELLYPLLIESSNDAAEVISYFLGKDKALELMNEKSKSILMTQTEFTDTSGFDPRNISTAKDLFYLSRYIFNNRYPLFKVTKGERVATVGQIGFDINNLWNKNVFPADSSLIGAKTGFIKEAKNTGVFLFRFLTKDNQKRNIAFILLKSSSTKNDIQAMYRWVQRNYALTPDY